MDSDLRRAAVVTLGELGRGDDWRDRADAGHSLAQFAEMPEAVELLLGLVLDRGDTFVTRRTAEGLLRRKDRIGLTIVASALAVANDNHADYIHTAIVATGTGHGKPRGERSRGAKLEGGAQGVAHR